jgi:hypothetical protein
MRSASVASPMPAPGATQSVRAPGRSPSLQRTAGRGEGLLALPEECELVATRIAEHELAIARRLYPWLAGLLHAGCSHRRVRIPDVVDLDVEQHPRPPSPSGRSWRLLVRLLGRSRGWHAFEVRRTFAQSLPAAWRAGAGRGRPVAAEVCWSRPGMPMPAIAPRSDSAAETPTAGAKPSVNAAADA